MNFKKPSYKVPSVTRDIVHKRDQVVVLGSVKPSTSDRIRYLKGLVYETFTGGLVPAGHRRRFDIYDTAKPTIRQLGAAGGESYNHAVARVKAAWVSESDWLTAVETLIPPCK